MPTNSLPSRRSRYTYARTRVALTLVLAMAAACPALTVKAATANWSPETLLATRLAFSEAAVRVRTGVNPDGSSVVAWENPTPVTGGLGFATQNQIFAAVRGTGSGAWSASTPLSAIGVSALNAGAVVDPVTGKATVLWAVGDVPYAASSSDAGATWSQEVIPGGPGFSFLPSSSTVDVDGAGNITVVLMKRRTATPSVFDVEAVVKPVNGPWLPPVALAAVDSATMISAPRLNVLSDGRALLTIGGTTWRRNSSGIWATPRAVSFAGFGVVDQTSADIDAKGKGYFVFRAVTGGVGAVFLTTSTPTSGWSAPRRVSLFDSIGLWLQVTASSSGRAIVSGYGGQGAVLVSATDNGGSTWGTPVNFGAGYKPSAVGSESGLFALGWSANTAAGVTYSIASGSGIGAASTAWATVTRGNLVQMESPSLAIAGRANSSTARTVSGWERQEETTTLSYGIGASLGNVGK